MVYQRGHKPASLNPSGQQKASPFAPRPFADPKKAPVAAEAQSSQQDKLDAEEELLQRRFDTGVAEPEQDPYPVQRVEPKPPIYTAFQSLGEPVQRVIIPGATKNDVVCDDSNDITATPAGFFLQYGGARYTIDASFKLDDHKEEKNIPFTINRMRKTATYAGAQVKTADEIKAELKAHADAKEADRKAKLGLVLAGIARGAKPVVRDSSYRHNQTGDKKSTFVGTNDNKETDIFIADTLLAKDAAIEVQGDGKGAHGGILCQIKLDATETLVFEYSSVDETLSVFHLGPGG